MNLTFSDSFIAIAIFLLFTTSCEMPPQFVHSNPDEAIIVAVFSRTKGYRHSSIEDGINLIKEIGDENDFEILATENPALLELYLDSGIDAVIFLNTSGNILGSSGEEKLKRFILDGGGFIGIHAAADTEYGWDWYGELLGGRFSNHPAIQDAVVRTTGLVHLSTSHLTSSWTRQDEWYNFTNIVDTNNILLTVDEGSYIGGEMGIDHPISWYRDIGLGRSWYTAMGHTSTSYSEPDFETHILDGILFAIGL